MPTLHSLIRQGEHQTQDFKFRVNDSKKIARSLVAFANTDGGRLLIGVKDNGKIAGVRSDEEYYMVETAASLYTRPEVPFRTVVWEVEGKTVVEIIVEPSEARPHQAKTDDNEWRAYVRVNDHNLVANRVLLKVWAQQGKKKGAKIQFSDTLRTLFKTMEELGPATFSKLQRTTKIPRFKLENLLAYFVTWEVINMDMNEKGTFYSLQQDPALLEKAYSQPTE